MCCYGCQAVAQSIIDNGLLSYYQHRTNKGVQVSELVPEQLQQLLNYDIEEIEQDFVDVDGLQKQVLLTVENVSCAACAWLIESKLRRLDGLITCNVNTTSARIRVTWHSSQLKLSQILLAISEVGYKAYPFQTDNAEQAQVAATKSYLRKLTVAGLCTMQVMMFALAFYFDVLGSISEGFFHYFRTLSLIISLPVVFYASLPFYKNAISALLAKRLNMDVPVSIAILLAFSASAIATVTQSGEVYFESVCMFSFFLLLGRYLEQRAKKKAAQSSSNLLKLIPSTALKLDNNKLTSVPAKLLKIGDIVLIKPGEIIPGDGIIIKGLSQTDEAILTGEQMPVTKAPNDWVYASTINISNTLTVQIKVERGQQLISQIITLQEQAVLDKPRLATLADTLAQYVVVVILLLATLTYIGWSLAGNEHAFWIALAVLVATCPCALSLATPSAYTAASSAMTQLGLLLKNGQALDTLTNIDHICFDKTGTMTTGKFNVADIDSVDESNEILKIVATLESHSQHPIAQAFSQYYDPTIMLENFTNHTGLGVEGHIDKIKFKLGSSEFLQISPDDSSAEHLYKTVIYLSKNEQHIASIYLKDDIRPEAYALVAFLKKRKITTTLLTGDSSGHAYYVAKQLGIDHLEKGQSPAQKLNYINTLQEQGSVVAMFGDGVNDAPVLAGAHLSFAMGGGSDIAKSSADIVLLHNSLASISRVIALSVKVQRIIKQNFCWSIGYNLTAVPFAIAGLLPPYLAALGMSLSSLVVVLNSLRLLKVKK